MNIERRIKRCKDAIRELEEDKDNLNIHGYWCLGYWKGRLSAFEDIQDEEEIKKEVLEL